MAVGFGGSGRTARGVERVQVEAGHLAHHRAVRHGGRHPVHGRRARFAAAGILAANKRALIKTMYFMKSSVRGPEFIEYGSGYGHPDPAFQVNPDTDPDLGFR